MEQDWAYSTPFDYIHGRYLNGAIRNWPRLMSQAYQYVTPAAESEVNHRIYLQNPNGIKESIILICICLGQDIGLFNSVLVWIDSDDILRILLSYELHMIYL
jgi:hypothetical protein